MILPFYIIIKIIKNFEDLEEDRFKHFNGWSYEQISTKYVGKSIYYGIFYLRRLLYAAILISFKDYPAIQIMSHLLLSSFFIIYLGNNYPFIQKNLNRLDLFNEACILICSYIFMSFVDESI